MSTASGPGAVAVEVELDSALERALAERASIQRQVEPRLDEHMRWMGVPGHPEVEVRPGSSIRPIVVRVNGRVQPYPLGLLARAWQRVARPRDHGAPYLQKGGDAALADGSWVAEVDELLRDELAAVKFVSEVVAQVVTRRPQALFGPEQAETYGRWIRLPPAQVARVARFLLGLGVSIKQSEILRETIEHHSQAGLPDRDIAEAAFDRLRARRVEIHCDPRYLSEITGGEPAETPVGVHASQFDESARRAFADAERRLFDALGLRPPELAWVPNEGVESPYIVIRVNDRFSPPVRAPRGGQVHVDAPAEDARRVAEDSEPFFDPLRRAQCSVAPSATAGEFEEAGLRVRTPAAWVAEAVHFELRARAGHVLGMEDVEYHLGRLEEQHSDIVLAAIAQTPICDITRILRALLREGHSIKDMLTIVERLLAYEEVVVTEPAEMFFDSRFPITDTMGYRPRWVRQFEFVRSGVAPLIVTKRGQALDALEIIPIEPEYEEAAERVAYLPPGMLRSWLDDEGQAKLCERVRRRARPIAPGEVPVFLTRRSARAGIREVLATELPDATVLAHEDLLPGTVVTKREPAA